MEKVSSFFLIKFIRGYVTHQWNLIPSLYRWEKEEFKRWFKFIEVVCGRSRTRIQESSPFCCVRGSPRITSSWSWKGFCLSSLILSYIWGIWCLEKLSELARKQQSTNRIQDSWFLGFLLILNNAFLSLLLFRKKMFCAFHVFLLIWM